MIEQDSRREFLQKTMVTAAAGLTLSAAAASGGELEWRNKQPGMHYRRLGRTNLMFSEVVCGDDPILARACHLHVQQVRNED